MLGNCQNKKPCDQDDCRYLLPAGRCVLGVAEAGGLSQRDVAKVLGISRSRVWQIEMQALAKMKKRLAWGVGGKI